MKILVTALLALVAAGSPAAWGQATATLEGAVVAQAPLYGGFPLPPAVVGCTLTVQVGPVATPAYLVQVRWYNPLACYASRVGDRVKIKAQIIGYVCDLDTCRQVPSALVVAKYERTP